MDGPSHESGRRTRRDGRQVKMHQTTVRFGPDLWVELEQEARLAGVTAAQFIRDSVLMRLAYVAGRRGDRDLDLALRLAVGEERSTSDGRAEQRENAS